MATSTLSGGTFTLAEELTVTRIGYGAMQLAGPHVMGPPADRDAAVAVLREALALGITHIDTSDFYVPARHQRDHQGSAAPLPRAAAHRHRGRGGA